MQYDENTLTVTELNRQVRTWLEGELGHVAVIGELSNLAKPGSGHFYFTLKDASAQLRCVFFRNHHDINAKLLKDGHQVIVKGKLSLYEARGDYQLIVHSLVEAGLGELYRQFELLKAKLQNAGLFDQARKKKLPPFPTTIAVVTSASGAALRDILTTLKRRFPLAAVRIYGSEVQGKDAAQQLIKAINQANQDAQAEVLILARGGGSIEDLWAFNDELLALTISQSTIPVVSGIGHETDFTIADFVADLRAATPTAAAEAVTPNQIDLLYSLDAYEKQLFRSMVRLVKHRQLLLSHHIAKLLSPAQIITRNWQAVDNLERQLFHSMSVFIQQKQKKLYTLISLLHSNNPLTLLKQAKAKVQSLEQALVHQVHNQFNRIKQHFGSQLATLHAVSPLATLDRGYALATYKNTILFNSHQVNTGDEVKVQLAKGSLICQVIARE